MVTMRALLVTGPGQVAVRDDVPQPVPGEGEVLVKVAYAGLNPTDWKHAYAPQLAPKVVGTVSGCDYAGTIVELGPGVEGVRVGQKVFGVVHGSNPSSPYPNGAFAEYVVADANLIIHVPEGLKLEVAAGQGVACVTTGQMLWQSQNLPSPEKPGDFSQDFLVWSGATGVGQWLIQIAHLSGLRVITTASLKHTERLKSLGASEVIDYRSPDVAQRIRDLTNNRLTSAGICEISPESLPVLVEALSDEGGVLSAITPRPLQKEDIKWTKEVTYATSLAYTLNGKAFETPIPVPAIPAHYELGKKIVKVVSQLLQEGKITPVPVRVAGGLESIAGAFEEMRLGKVSGERIVFKIEE
ncbi:GroES-like protein [Exidia glandulosa HHB12029]|uniref:GroES-like protein n=1 Tax=Exidia glandulosa HHB12029 TaxID=1314781 RepID=A0A165L4Z6_EXIGL|nr:GroES-like protein [Exidia glandulosa HHB12029]